MHLSFKYTVLGTHLNCWADCCDSELVGSVSGYKREEDVVTLTY